MIKKTLIISLSSLFVLLSGCTDQKNILTPIVSDNSIISKSFTSGDQSIIEKMIYEKIDMVMSGTWDKKLQIDTIHDSGNAVKGSWYASDRWSWISWKGLDGKWNTSIDTDGYNCDEIDMIPTEYKSFFAIDQRVKGENGGEICRVLNVPMTKEQMIEEQKNSTNNQ